MALELGVIAFAKDEQGQLVVRLRTPSGNPQFRMQPEQIPPAVALAIGALEDAIAQAALGRLEGLVATNEDLRGRLEAARAECIAAKAAVDASPLSASAKAEVKALIDNVLADLGAS